MRTVTTKIANPACTLGKSQVPKKLYKLVSDAITAIAFQGISAAPPLSDGAADGIFVRTSVGWNV